MGQLSRQYGEPSPVRPSLISSSDLNVMYICEHEMHRIPMLTLWQTTSYRWRA
jgi:hypothetical protein